MAKEPISVESIERFVGETAYDPYGRIRGTIVSVESDVDGVVKTITLETESKEIHFYPSEAVYINNDRVVVWPEWKVLAQKVITNYQRAIKRLKSLEDMYSRNEIPSKIYHELRRKLDHGLSKLKEDTSRLKKMIDRRVNEIEDANLSLERAIANLKLAYLAGEIGEKAYKTAIEHLRSAKESNTQELEDIKKVKSRIEALESGAHTILREREEKTAKVEQKKPEQPQIPTQIQPIPVKLLEG